MHAGTSCEKYSFKTDTETSQTDEMLQQLVTIIYRR